MAIKTPSQWASENNVINTPKIVSPSSFQSGGSKIKSPSEYQSESYNTEFTNAQSQGPIVSSLGQQKQPLDLSGLDTETANKFNNINNSILSKEDKTKGPSTAGTKFRWLGKQLMKPIGVAAEEFEGVGTAIGIMLKPLVTKDISFPEASKKALNELVKAQQDAGDVLSGKTETSFSKKTKEMDWRQNDKIIKKTDAVLGLGADLMLDPLNFIPVTKLVKGAIAAKGLNPAIDVTKAVISKSKPAKWLKEIFSTATADKAFMNVVNKFRNLAQYRKGKSLEEAIALQKDLVKLSKEIPEVNKLVTDSLENPKIYESITDPRVKEIVDGLKLTYQTALEESKAVGLKVGEIEQYAPHIRTKESFLNKLKSDMGLGSKEFSKGAIEKGRKIEGTVSEINADKMVKFFEDNPAIQLAKKGQTYAKAITSQEFANAVKSFALKEGDDLVEVANPMLKGLKFTAEQARIIDNYYTGIKPEEIKVALKGFDKVQNIWKAQALISPSYHIRNIVGNLWNNYLAGVNPFQYAKATDIQLNPKKYAGLIDEMKQVGVLDEGWYAKDIGEEVVDRVSGVKNWKKGINPLSMQNYVFKGNRAIGTGLENNARIAHYLHVKSLGKTAEEAAESVKKYLFDYSDLTPTEKNIFKRIAPFYTWTSKNIPLQLNQLITNPAKFTVPYKIINDIESGVVKPNEKFMNDYMKNNVPVRIRTNEKGETEYFMLGQWLPFASAIDILSQPIDNFIGMSSPFIKGPIEATTNTSLYFKNTMGDRSKIEQYPGQQEEVWTPATGQTLMRKKYSNMLKNIRVLNDINKWIDSEDPTKTADSWQVKLINTLFGKAGTYNVQKSKYFFDKDTDEYLQGLESALKAANKKGYAGTAEATKLRKEIIELKKQRREQE